MHGKHALVLAVGKTRGRTTSEQIDFNGVVAAVEAAKGAGVRKIVHITSFGVESPSRWFTVLLNWIGGMGLGWKLEAEQALRASGVYRRLVSTRMNARVH